MRSRTLVIGLLIMFVLFWMPTPFVVIQPGSADLVGPMIHMDGGYDNKNGALRLTTVSMSVPSANMASYLYALVNTHADVRLKSEVFGKGETSEEYTERQSFQMISSQSDAIQAAYNQAGISYQVIVDEVRVLGTVEDMPASESFQVGDKVLQVDGISIENGEQLVEIVTSKRVGDTIPVLIERGEQEIRLDVQLAENDNHQPAIGIWIADVLKVQPEDPSLEVHMKTGKIGGPSAGLMFALEILNRLVPEDITKGYDIAGTGEIDPTGQVGPIGGVQYKVVAAHKAGADIFFTPVENAPLAMEKAEKINTSMHIVPVKTLNDALAYLDTLPVKYNGD